MAELVNPFNTLQTLPNSKKQFYSLPALEKLGKGRIDRLPVTIRIMLESLLRNCNNQLAKEEDVINLIQWDAKNPSLADIPFVVSRVILQDFTGVPLLVDLAAMRDAMAERKLDASRVEPRVPVDLVVDHSVQVDRAGTKDAYKFNLEIEFGRNGERYSFLKWGQKAFDALQIVPPGIGIVHQVNLEYLASVVIEKKEGSHTVLYPDTLVGTDSHTTMINGLGVLGWGVGGIEAEAAMLGQPVFLQSPEVIGLHLSGKLREGITATDLTLAITQLLRKEKVVGKFVEFYGEGAASLTVADRATIGNMAPEYGATVGFFSVDDKTLEYLRMTGRSEEQIEQIREYLTAQKLFGIPRKGEVDYTKTLELDLYSIVPSVSGPKRPQDRIELISVKSKFRELLDAPVASGGYGKPADEGPKRIGVHAGGYFSLDIPHDMGGTSQLEEGKVPLIWSEAEMVTNRPMSHAVMNPGYLETKKCDIVLQNGTIVIAAITSCTNTSNPSVMIAAGLIAKKALARGLKVNPMVKTSLAPGSRVVTDYLEKTGLQSSLDALGFQLVAYGCTTCIGNSGPLEEHIENAIKEHDLIVASVLSGNRNFEARIHSAVKANFLMSPPLVVAFAIAGRIDIDMEKEPLGIDKSGHPVFLRDIWPTTEEIRKTVEEGIQPEMFKERYSKVLDGDPLWNEIPMKETSLYLWDEKSTYIRKPPYFDGVTKELPDLHDTLKNMRPLALFGDSVTTDHISPAGAFYADSPAGEYLLSHGIPENEFNSYGSRRGNHEVMLRGTFANVRLRNKMAEGKEGGYTKLMPEGTPISIYEASRIYIKKDVPLIIFAGKDYGMGSSRDWAAKGTALLGVKVVVAGSFERIHRTNLIGMGVLPLQFEEGDSWESLGITGDELFSIKGFDEKIKSGSKVTLEITSKGQKREVSLLSRLDTPSEALYYRHGGILPFILRKNL
jgi:aconitate hydratase